MTTAHEISAASHPHHARTAGPPSSSRSFSPTLPAQFFRWTGAARVDVGTALLERPLLRDGLRQARAQPVADDHVCTRPLRSAARHTRNTPHGPCCNELFNPPVAASAQVDSSLLQQRARAPILAAFPPPRQRTSASARSVCRASRVARCRHCEHQLCARRWYLFYRIRCACRPSMVASRRGVRLRTSDPCVYNHSRPLLGRPQACEIW